MDKIQVSLKSTDDGAANVFRRALSLLFLDVMYCITDMAL